MKILSKTIENEETEGFDNTFLFLTICVKNAILKPS